MLGTVAHLAYSLVPWAMTTWGIGGMNMCVIRLFELEVTRDGLGLCW